MTARRLIRVRQGLQDLADSVANDIRAVAGKDAEVWAVTHSLGGIVLRHIMALPDHGEPLCVSSC